MDLGRRGFPEFQNRGDSHRSADRLGEEESESSTGEGPDVLRRHRAGKCGSGLQAPKPTPEWADVGAG